MRRTALLLPVVLAATACSSDVRPIPVISFDDDASTGVRFDAGGTAAPDAQSVDGGGPEGNDSGTPADSGTRRRDSGVTDSGTTPDDSGTTPDDSGTTPDDSGTTPDDSGTTPDDSGTTPTDSGTPTNDGTPTRMQCTGNFGNGLSSGFGRMDGYLVSVIPPGGPRTCNGDSGHVHLQVLIQGSVYDVAVNVDTYQTTRDMPVPDGAWSEGWTQSVRLDYTQLGLHSTDFMPVSDAAGSIESFLQNANHVSIFATGYGPTGAHDVHRHYGGDDGAIVIDPLSPTAHVMFFCFNNQTF